MRAAASSTASGRLSSRRQSSATVSLAPTRARAQKSSTASSSVKRRHRVGDLAVDAQELAARHEHPQLRTGAEQRREVRRRLDDLLEVVEQEQHLPLADVLGERHASRRASARSCPTTKRRVADRRQPHPEDTRGEVADELRRGFDREPRLAGPARARERHEPRTLIADEGDNLRHLALAADERRHRPRQVRVRDRPQRRETAVAELEQRNRLRKVLEPVLAELADVASTSARVACESSTWPPWPALMILAARCTSSPT